MSLVSAQSYFKHRKNRQGDLTIELVRRDSRVSGKSYSTFQCFGCTPMTQIGLLIQMSIDHMLRVILIAFTTKSVLIARNSKLACETVALAVHHHEQLSYNMDQAFKSSSGNGHGMRLHQ